MLVHHLTLAESTSPQLLQETCQKPEKKQPGESVEDKRIEKEDVKLMPQIVFLWTKKYVSHLGGVIFLFHLRVREHVRDLLVLKQLFRGDLVATGIEPGAIERCPVENPVDFVKLMLDICGVFARQPG